MSKVNCPACGDTGYRADATLCFCPAAEKYWRDEEMIRVYVVSKNGEEIATLDSLEECLDTVHTSLSELMSDVNNLSVISIQVRPGREDEL